MSKRKEKDNIECPENITLNKAKEKLAQSKLEQNKLMSEGKKHCKRELLDYYQLQLNEEQFNENKRRKF